MIRSRTVTCWTLGLASLSGFGCSSSDDATQAGSIATSTSVETAAAADPWLNIDQRRRIDQLISTFENSTTDIDYDYAENIGDGRGVTAGRAGFTTATCDAAQVIRVYGDTTPDNDLARFLPELDRLCEEASDDTSGLPEADYIEAWTVAAGDEAFRAAQDAVVDVGVLRARDGDRG